MATSYPAAPVRNYPASLPRGNAAARTHCARAPRRQVVASAPAPARMRRETPAASHQAWKIVGEAFVTLGAIALIYFACLGLAGTMLGWSVAN